MDKQWTEADMQDVVYIHAAIKNHELVVPNSCLFAWEADVLSVTKSGFIHEFEIKVTRSDFKADQKKRRTVLLQNPTVQGYFGLRDYDRPNYFHYVVPEGMVSVDEVPDNAGLIYAKKFAKGHHLYYGLTDVIKDAPRLHTNKITEKQRLQMERSLIHRYWRQRLNLKYVETPAERQAREMYG